MPLKQPLVDIDQRELPVGTVLRRWYRGRLVEVTVVPFRPARGRTEAARLHGWWRYEWEGRRVRTLSEVAYAVTGDRYLSGAHFFGLHRKRRGPDPRRDPGVR